MERMQVFIGRSAAASPATGKAEQHAAELKRLVDAALTPSAKKLH
jgi:2-oxoglutarate dehydrogenase complex dehydrogenase (E1) component-like enzyme